MSTNAYEEMLEYLDGQRKKLAGMRERLRNNTRLALKHTVT